MSRTDLLAKSILCFFITIGTSTPSHALAFRNLDFEETIVGSVGIGGTGGTLLTGWTLGFEGPSAQGVRGPGYDVPCLGSRCVSVHDAASPFFRPIEGRFSTLIQGGTFSTGNTFISQTGVVPDNASEISLLAYAASNGLSQPLQQLHVLANGIGLDPLGSPPSAPNSVLSFLQFDISPFAGQAIELRIAVDNAPGTESSILVDSIAFSVPEPGTSTLQLLGLLFLFAVTKKRKTCLARCWPNP